MKKTYKNLKWRLLESMSCQTATEPQAKGKPRASAHPAVCRALWSTSWGITLEILTRCSNTSLTFTILEQWYQQVLGSRRSEDHRGWLWGNLCFIQRPSGEIAGKFLEEVIGSWRSWGPSPGQLYLQGSVTPSPVGGAHQHNTSISAASPLRFFWF